MPPSYRNHAFALAVALAAALGAPASAFETTVDELCAGDIVTIELTRGGSVSGHARSYDGLCLGLMTEGGLLRLDDDIIAAIEVDLRTSELPLPRVEIPTTDEAEKRARRARSRAARLAVASIFLPGVGLAATGQPGLGALYLAGVLVIDAVIVLALALNWDLVGAAALGAVEISARISSAGLAYRSGLRLYAGVVPVGEDRWACAAGIVLRL